ncbi:hypothetical protein C0J52_10629 [Blattella germanica]|nr:hypothetical protein C0J52_10629 [Blattella germanica]
MSCNVRFPNYSRHYQPQRAEYKKHVQRYGTNQTAPGLVFENKIIHAQKCLKVSPLFLNSRPIADPKLKDIQRLKKFVPSVHRTFYDSLTSKALDRRTLGLNNQNNN